MLPFDTNTHPTNSKAAHIRQQKLYGQLIESNPNKQMRKRTATA